MITVYDSFGIPRQVTIEEFIAIEEKKLIELFEMAGKDALL
jgi:hypothetical protein